MIGIFLVASASASDLNGTTDDDLASYDDKDDISICEIEENSIDELSENDDTEIISINYLPKNSSEIQGCIDSADEDDTIVLDGYYLINSTINVGKKLTFVGINDATIDGNNSVGLFNVSDDGVTFKNITFKNGYTGHYGGAVYFSGSNGSVVNCSFICNSAVNVGGAIYFNGEGSSVVDCRFVNNSAGSYGGAVYFNRAGTSVVNCNFTGNSANSEGAVYLNKEGYVVNCSFVNNSAKKHGGAMYGGHAVNCTFIINSATSNAGAVHFADAINCVFIKNKAKYGGAMLGSAINCTFINNSATEEGGAIYSYHDVVNCSFIGNSANFGGALYNIHSVVNCSFIRNKAISGGGASYGGGNFENSTFIENKGNTGAMFYGTALNCTFIGNDGRSDVGAIEEGSAINCKFVNNKGKSGALKGNALNCTFINNSGSIGGAVYAMNYIGTEPPKSYSVENCTFINNHATNSGGAVYAGKVINCIFINNSAKYGGAVISRIVWDSSVVNCTFINNSASDGGAVHGDIAVNCSFVNNSASHYGGAVYDGNVVNCSFVNNSASHYGGAVYDGNVVNCSFVNNSASDGGALYGTGTINSSFDSNHALENGGAISGGSAVNCTFTNNSASVGGAIFNATVNNCNFYNNSADFGGAIADCNLLNSTFINNSAIFGGAVFEDNLKQNCTIRDCIFEKNSAEGGGAIYVENAMNISYCEFIDCFANFQGGAVYVNQSANITHCSFRNCTSDEYHTCMAVNSSQSDYLVQDCTFDKYPDNINYHYVSTLISQNLTYFNGEEGILMANLSDMRGSLSGKVLFLRVNGTKYNVTTDSNGLALFNIPDYLNKAGVYNCSVIFEGDNVSNPVSVNVTVTINKHASILNSSDLILYKNEYGGVIANLSNIRGPLKNKKIIFTINDVTRQITTNENGSAEFKVLNFVNGKGEYTVGISFEGDDFNLPASTNVTFLYIDYKGVLTASVDGKYFNDTILYFNLVNYRNNKPISDAPIKLVFSNGVVVNLTTDVDGNADYRMPFNPDYYDVTASVDEQYVSVNKVTIEEIEINKLFGVIEHSLWNSNKTLRFKLSSRYNDDVFRNVKINLKFNNNEEAEIVSDENGIASYDILFPKGIYSVSVTVNGDYKEFDPDYISNIVVSNDLNCSINFTNDIVFDFGEYGSTNFTVDGGIVEYDHIRVVGHPEAIIGVINNTISVSYLSVGKYTLLVDVTPDDYHNPVTSTVNITVNNVKSKVTIKSGVVFEYGGSASIHVTVDGGIVERKNIRILNYPEANIGLSGQVITISGLNVGNYVLSVTSTPDSDHTAATSNVTVTVKKATAVISASKATVALKKGAMWVVKIVDSKSKNPIAKMNVALKVYSGKKFTVINLKTNSKGEVSYQTRKLSKGTHKIVVSVTDSRYNFNTLTSSIKVVKQTPLKFKLKKKVDDNGGSLRSFLVLNKKTKKGVNGIKVKVLIYTGKKYKTYTFKTKKIKGKKVTYNGAFGFATNKFSVGKHKVKIMPASIKYKGSVKTTIKITKKARKGPKFMREV